MTNKMTDFPILRNDYYAYLMVNDMYNTYSIKDSYLIFHKLSLLRQGDRLNINGIGLLEIIAVEHDKLDLESLIYNEIAIKCVVLM